MLANRLVTDRAAAPSPGNGGATPRRRMLAARLGLAVGAALTVSLAACSGAGAPGGTSTTASSTTGRVEPTSPTTSSKATTAGGAGSSSSSTSSTPAPRTAERCAQTLVDGMSPPERAGQLLMVGLDVNAGTGSLDDLVADRHLGGVILLGGWHSGSGPVEAATRHLNSLTETSDPGLLIAADQEGGNVQQLRGGGFTRLPTAMAQQQLPPGQLMTLAATSAKELRRAGINVNLAPVADTVPTDLGRANDPIGQWDRQFSSDPDEVARALGSFIKGMHRGGVAATVKHFPGIGRITGNTDLTSEGITDTTTTATDRYLRPFASAIRDRADLVMVGSAIYSRIDPGVNATFSTRIISGMLRRDLGYDGVVITDDVGSAKAVSSTPVGQRATKFVEAGGDIVLTARPGTVPAMHDALLERMSRSTAFADKVRASAERVLTLKVRRDLATCD